MTTWTETDFDRLNWHDNSVHALALHEGEDGTGELVLDIDFIVEWLQPNPTLFRYLIAPATLTFRRVCDLKLCVDYTSCGMGPFAIDGIQRDSKVYANGYSTFSWRIPINFPCGEVTFIADGFMQVLRSQPREFDRMTLSAAERDTGAGA